MNFWQAWKEWLGTATGLPDSTLHILFGMALLLLLAGLLRRVPWNWRAWTALIVLETINEIYDMLNPASGENRPAASLHDFWLTMLCPTLLLLFVPILIRRAERRKTPSADRFEQPLE